jgi:hypothetical protein
VHATVPDEHVARFDVAVHDTRRVDGGQRVEQRCADLRGRRDGERAVSPHDP